MSRLLTLFLVLTAAIGSGCSRRPPPPLPREDVTASPLPAPVDSQPEPVPTVPAPRLEVVIEPPVINRGGSALMRWEAQEADRVVIDHNIGVMEASGRIRFFPDETTRYVITAEGPGGRTVRAVTVEVRDHTDATVNEHDLLDLPLSEQFSYFVQAVFFTYDSAELDPQAKAILDKNIGWLNQADHRGIRFLIEGHCDQRGTEEYNLALGDRRAQAVLQYLTRGGIDPSRIQALSLGEERPFDTRETEEAWALNRRANFALIGED